MFVGSSFSLASYFPVPISFSSRHANWKMALLVPNIAKVQCIESNVKLRMSTCYFPLFSFFEKENLRTLHEIKECLVFS